MKIPFLNRESNTIIGSIQRELLYPLFYLFAYSAIRGKASLKNFASSCHVGPKVLNLSELTEGHSQPLLELHAQVSQGVAGYHLAQAGVSFAQEVLGKIKD